MTTACGGDAVAADVIYEADFVFPQAIRGSDLAVVGSFIDLAGDEAPPFECPDRDIVQRSPLGRPSHRRFGFIPDDHHHQVDGDDRRAFSELPYLSERIAGRDGIRLELVRELFNADQTSYPDGGLREGTRYYYRLFVVNDLDETAGATRSRRISPTPFPIPFCSMNPPASGTNRLTLSWT